MKKLVILLAVLTFCLPTYGSILVYKTSTMATLFDLTENEMAKEKELGYLVLDIDLTTQTVNEAQHVTYWGVKTDKKQQTLVVTVVFYDDVDGYIVADYWSYDTDAVLYGKTVDGKPVGLTGKDVAKSLKGYMLVYPNDLGSGTISATLDTKLTKDAAGKSITQVVAAIVAVLTDKGYVDQKDTTKPTPDPMTWATVPTATSDTTITMTATTATDADSPPVEYFFTNKSVSGHNSGWQISPIFTDNGLTPNTTYTYNVKAQDNAPVPNETAASADANATTLKTADTTPPTPSPMQWATGGEPNAISDSAIRMTAAEANDTQGIDAYYFTCVTDGNQDSGWKDADEDSANWTASTRTWISTGLTPEHTYAYNVKARDKALVPNETLPSTPDANATTGVDITPPSPDPMTWAIVPDATGASSIKMKATPALDGSPPVQYQFWYTVGGTGEARGWNDDPNFEDTGLSENSMYGYKVRARDAKLNTTQWSAPQTAQTAITIQTQINEALAERAAGYPPVTVTIVAGTYNEDLYIGEPNVTLNSASGAASTIIQLQGGDWIGIDIDGPGCTLGGSAGHGFTIIGDDDTTQCIDTADNTEVSYCDINSVGDADRGVRDRAYDGVRIQHNNFFTDDSDSAIYVGGGAGEYIEDLDISNNTCDAPAVSWFVNFASTDGNNITTSGNITDCGILIGVGGNGTALENLTISNNTFNHGSGINVYENTAGTDPNRLTNVDISDNTFAAGSNGSALLIYGIDPCDIDWDYVVFTQNKILRTPGGANYTVFNMIGAGTLLNAEFNYWGDENGPTNGCDCGLGASISTNVDFENFYTNTAMTTDANCVDLCP